MIKAKKLGVWKFIHQKFNSNYAKEIFITEMGLEIYGNGLQTRSFCYVSDLITGLVTFMNTDNFTGPVNIGNPTELEVKELAEKIIKLTKSKSKIIYKELPQDDPLKRRPDITLAKKMLKWEPKVSIDEGLTNTIEFFRQKLNK